jgi:HEAT repeat protein
MEISQSDSAPKSTPPPPSFTSDLMNAILMTIFTVILWVLFFQYYGVLGALIPLFLGVSVGTLVGTILLFFFSFSLVVRWLEIIAYQIASWRTNVPYMNYRTKCPFLVRKRLAFSCRAEQIAPFELEIFEKCHKQTMWEACWPDRIPSILEKYDEAPANMKQQFAFILAAMKELASPAGDKMYEALINDTLEVEARIAAGYALEEMRNESGIKPLIEMVGQFDQRTDQMIRAILGRYKEMAIPQLIEAIQNCDNDIQCGGFIEILGKTKQDSVIPTLTNLLVDDSAGEYTKLQIIYALQTISSEESFKVLISHLEIATEEEQAVIKEACLSRGIISFPILIDLLSSPEISEEYYARVGDVLAEVDASTYDKFFTKLGELKGSETVQRLASILKENTPEEEEFLKIHEVISKHLSSPISS